jgi:hypothetical protein
MVEMLDELRRMGVTEQTVQLERDGWILVAALSPEVAPEWAGVKRAWAASSRPDTAPSETPAGVAAVALLASSVICSPPSWQRLNDLSQTRLDELRHAGGHR